MNQRDFMIKITWSQLRAVSFVVQAELESIPDIKAASQWWPRMELNKIPSGPKMA